MPNLNLTTALEVDKVNQFENEFITHGYAASIFLKNKLNSAEQESIALKKKQNFPPPLKSIFIL